jgi:hypothetical protein
MPRIISDELFDGLMQCVKAQRLLGVMGKLEKLQEEAKFVVQQPSLSVSFAEGIGEYEVFVGKGVFRDGPKTNNN